LLRLSLGGITLLELELVYLGGFQFQLCDSILVEVAKVFDLVNDDLVKLLQMVRGKKRYGLVKARCRCQRNFLLHIRRAYLELDRELGLFARLERAWAALLGVCRFAHLESNRKTLANNKAALSLVANGFFKLIFGERSW